MSVFSSLNTAYSGLKTSQILVDTTSHNISNANNEYYTRQRVELSVARPLHTSSGEIGQGADVTQIARIHNEFISARYKKADGDFEYAQTEYKFLNEVSSYFSDVDGSGIFNDLETYFNAWQAFSINPNDSANKIALAEYTSTMTQNINYSYNQIKGLQEDVNKEVEVAIKEFNQLGEKIVEVNKKLKESEAGGYNANDLRDERDRLELAMGKLVNISVFKTPAKLNTSLDTSLAEPIEQYNMTIGGHSIINREKFKPLTLDNKDIASKLFNINYETGGSSINITDLIRGGKVGALLELRGREINTKSALPDDGKLQKYLDNLNSFSKTLAQSTNNIYAASAKDKMATDLLTVTKNYENFTLAGTDVLSTTTLKINTAENTVIGKKPNFSVAVYDNDGNLLASKKIELSNTSTMNSIVTSINSDSDDNIDNDYTNDVNDYFSAEFSEGYFKLNPSALASEKEYKISVIDDTEVPSNFAGAIGLSKFFDGESGDKIKLDADYKNEPLKINAFQSPVDGDNAVANAMLQLQFDKVSYYKRNGVEFASQETLTSFYKLLVTDVASDAKGASLSKDSKEAIYSTIKIELDNISKVSLDEELSNLLKFQTSYQANAKVVTTIDAMMQTLLGMKQ